MEARIAGVSDKVDSVFFELIQENLLDRVDQNLLVSRSMNSLVDTELVSILVAEHGADWASWVERLRVGTPSVVLIVRNEDESADQLVARIREQTDVIEARGERLGRAVVIGTSEGGAQRLEDRYRVLRALAAPMSVEREGTLILDGAADRFAMRAMADAMQDALHGSGVRVVLHRSRVADVA